MSRGFTLIEVVVSLLILEVAVVGVLGALVLASEFSGRARALERSVVAFESVVDSLRGLDSVSVSPDSMAFEGGVVRWSLSSDGRLTVSASGREGSGVHAVIRTPLR